MAGLMLEKLAPAGEGIALSDGIFFLLHLLSEIAKFDLLFGIICGKIQRLIIGCDIEWFGSMKRS